MPYEKYNDPIEVITLFQGMKVTPVRFKWGKHSYAVTQVLHVHTIHDGRERIHMFSVANDTESFRLAFHTEIMQWFLKEHYVE